MEEQVTDPLSLSCSPLGNSLFSRPCAFYCRFVARGRRARSDGAHPPPPLRPSRSASRAVSPLIAAPSPSVVPGRQSSSPSAATRLRREEQPQRVDPGAAASIPREKGEGSGEIYSQLSLSAFCGDSSVELVAVNPACALPAPFPPPVDHARPAGSGSQQPLLHQGGRSALGALMPQSEALPVTDLREQILQLIEHDFNDQEEKSRAELLEKLNRCKRDTLIELCRSFDIIGSRANRKEELVFFLMGFIKDHCSGIDGVNSDKKIKKRRRVKEDENLSTGKPSKKKKREGEEEADERKGVEDRVKHSDSDLMDNKYSCADSKNGKFPNEQTNFEPSERINDSVSENLDGASLSEVPIPTDEQVIITTPPTKFVTAAEGDSTDVKALQRKMSSITKKKTTPKEDCKVKLCGKRESKGDTKPRKQAIKPSKDELREAVFLILDTADFATMTFGDVVKEVDKYFGKDLFERKPLIRCLIEEELFRLADEAEKKELEESEAAEAKARAEQAAKAIAQVQTVESVINKQNVLQAGRDSNTKSSLMNANDSANKKSIGGGASVESAFKKNSCYAAEGSEVHKADADTTNNNITKDGNGEMVAVVPIANGDCTLQLQGSSNVEAETMKNNNVETLEGSKDGKVKGASNGENNDTEVGRNERNRGGNVGSNAEAVNCCEAEESNNHGNNERVEHTEDDKAQEANHNENSANVQIHGDGDGEAKERDIDEEQSQADGGSSSKAEDAEHNENTKVDANSSKNGTTAENGKTDVDVKGNSDGTAEGSPV